MKRIVSALLLITFLNGCSLPLVGSLTSSGITGVATGNYQKSLVSSTIDLAVHKSTGKTPGQHLYASLSNKYTDKKLKKHFPNGEIKWPGWHTYVKSTDYTVLDKYAPNFKVIPSNKPAQTFSKKASIKLHQAKLKRNRNQITHVRYPAIN